MHPTSQFDAALAQHRHQSTERERAFLVARRRRERRADRRPATVPLSARGLTRDDLALAR